MKTLICAMLMATTISGAGCSSGKGVRAETSPPSNRSGSPRGAIPVSAVKAQRQDLVNRLDLTGTITPYEQVTLYARTSGYLKSIHVDIGDRVRKGQVVAALDVPEMETALGEKRAALLKAEALLDQARAAVEQSRAELEFAEVNHKRLKDIHDRDSDLLPEQDVDQARASYGVAQGKLKSAEAQVKVAEAAVASARAELATLETLMQYSRIVAPMAGVVTERFVDPGALIQVASTSRTQAAPLVSIARVDRLRILVDVPEPSVPRVHAGTDAMVQAQDLLEGSFSARVARVGKVLDLGSRTMRAEIDLLNPEERLRPGMTAKVSLQLQRTENAVTVPISALHSQGAECVVFVAEGGQARAIRVKTGLESPEWIQILEGLKGGEDVIVASAELLKDGAAVTIRP